MQKKLIALAIAGLASSGAFAQSNVVIYGVMDIGYANAESEQIVSAANPTGKDNKFSGTANGVLSGNRIGFRVEEDLGNGWKAGGLWEMGTMAIDGGANSGASGANGIGSTRQSYVQLSSAKYGSFQGGRIYPAAANAAGKFDPEAAATFGPVNRITGALGLTTDGGQTTGNSRINNSLAWLSPNWNGFSGQIQYAFGENGEQTKAVAGTGASLASVTCLTAGVVTVVATAAICTGGGGAVVSTTAAVAAVAAVPGGNSQDSRFWGMGIDYTNGPLSVGFTYADWNDWGGTASGTPSRDLTEWFIGGSYDFGMVKVLGSYQDFDMDNMTASASQGVTVAGGTRGANSEGDIWSIGVVVPVFKVGAITASYASLDRSIRAGTGLARTNADADGWAISYRHSLSKRTTAYIGYTQLDNDGGPLTGGTLGISREGLNNPAAGKDSSGYAMGVRHTW